MFKDRKEACISCSKCRFSQLCLARNLAPQELQKLDEIITKVKILAKGDHLYRENDKMEYLYAIHQGTIKDYYGDENGKEYINNFYLAGDVLGLEGVPYKKYHFSAVALDDVIACAIPVNKFLTEIQHHPNLLRRYIDIASYKMTNDKHIRVSTNAKVRLADFLVNILYRVEERGNNQLKIDLPISQIDIGNMVGMANETVNRILRQFQKENIIEVVDKEIHITDVKKLRSLGNSTLQVGQQ